MPVIKVKKKDIDDLKNKIKFNITTNKFNQYKVFHLHNSYHLGDNVFNFILFYIIKPFIEQNNIKICYYAKKEYLPQLKDFLCSKNFYLYDLENKPPTSIELWINNYLFNYRHDKQEIPINFNLYYINFFNKVLQNLNFGISISKFYYNDKNLINMYNNLNDKYKNVDILVINSTPLSGQFDYNKEQWDNYLVYLNSNFKIVTTTKVNDLTCTMDDNLFIKDIAAISTHVKVVIAINSGVLPSLLNMDTLQNVKHFYIFDNRCYYSYPNFENKNLITDISIQELQNFII
jgi:hypothetical protein